MDRQRLYMDWNAGAPLRQDVRVRLAEVFARGGNASSVHAEGRAARAVVEAAREAVAALAGVDPSGVTFTSGGTEANVTALVPDWTLAGRPARFDRLLVSAMEHPSVARGGRFAADAVETIPVDRDGVVRLDWLADRLAALSADGLRALVSVMAASNETGVIQPLAAVAALVRDHGGLFHVDAVQAAGRIPIDLSSWGADIASLSAHKIGGPQGIGALVRHAGAAFAPLLTGGGQESYARAGTEPVALIDAFGLAATGARADLGMTAGVRARRDALERAVRQAVPDAVVFSAGADRLPNTLAFALPGIPAETLVIAMDLGGIAVSSGSACSSGKVRRSAALSAMGFDPSTAAGGVRVSIGPTTTDTDVERFAQVFTDACRSMRKHRATRAA
jgi:cysteine desulfurase